MKSGKCPKCSCCEIIRAEAADYAADNTEYQMAVTAAPRWIFSGRNPGDPYGVLYMLVCRECGFVEWYARDAYKIPIGAEHKTVLLRDGKEGVD